MEEFPGAERSTDILRLFREDLDMSDRVIAFRQAADQMREQVEQLATTENIERINNSFDTTFIFNAHGGAIDAGQSLSRVEDPFITFVEGTGDADMDDNSLFFASIQNAFDVIYNGQNPQIPNLPLNNETAWQYWRDRGLFAKGSVVMSVDIRHYSKRLLDALIGNDYDQQYLSSSIPAYVLRGKDYETILEEQKKKGQLIMYSNAVRELTSAKQIVETLLRCLDTESSPATQETGTGDKLRALMQRQRTMVEKLPTYIIYGSGHHAMMHVFKNLGIEVKREFPGAVDSPAGFSHAGDIKGQFSAAHPFGLSEERIDKYAKQHIIESILWLPLDLPTEYGTVPEDDSVIKSIWPKISWIARRPELVDKAQEIYAEFQTDSTVPLRILEQYGVRLRKIG